MRTNRQLVLVALLTCMAHKVGERWKWSSVGKQLPPVLRAKEIESLKALGLVAETDEGELRLTDSGRLTARNSRSLALERGGVLAVPPSEEAS